MHLVANVTELNARTETLHFDAAIFDLDGVITRTAAVHASAWKRMFDEFLRRRAIRGLEPFREFTRRDYLAFVDGRPRYAGVKSFLDSRQIDLPFGDPENHATKETVCGLGNRKNDLFNQVLEEEGVEVYESTLELVKRLRASGVRVGVASSSKNCAAVLKRTGIAGLFETCVDGLVSEREGLRGKPEPDIFIVASENLGARPPQAMVVEDAVSGVQAAARGHFGLVLGVARENNADELRQNGADIVVSDLAEISLEEIDGWFASGAQEQNELEAVIRGAI